MSETDSIVRLESCHLALGLDIETLFGSLSIHQIRNPCPKVQTCPVGALHKPFCSTLESKQLDCKMAQPQNPVDEGPGDDGLGAILAEEDVDVDDSDALNMFLGDGLALALASGKKLGDSKEYVAHADDAVDYEDEDELADEEQEDSVMNDVEEKKDGETDEDDWAKEFSEDLKIKKEFHSDEDENENEDEDKLHPEIPSTRASLALQHSISTVADSSFSSSAPSGAQSVSGPESVFGGYPLQDDSQMEEIKPSHEELEHQVLPDEDFVANTMLFQDMEAPEESRPLRMSALFAPEPVRLSLPKPHSVKRMVTI
ncbi:hypothetical protein V1509DRAFT_609900 [Lipomyces kononenkoae]